MLTEQEMRLDDILRHLAESLDISPTEYERAVQSYKAIGDWLEDGYKDGEYPDSAVKPEIYPQGSIRLGTVVKPFRESKDAAYDVDLVCELQYENIAWSSKNAQLVKQMVGNRLKAHTTYYEKIDDEGKRCWTLEYAKDNGIGFHIDVLPCVPDFGRGAEITGLKPGNPDTRPEFTRTTIALTDKDDDRNPRYEWRSGNPHGFAEWFRKRNTTFERFAADQKADVFKKLRSSQSQQALYESVQAVPDQLVRTPLQRTIQVLKRHRDIRFSRQGHSDPLTNPKFKPISMIITTLVARLYEGEGDVLTSLMNAVTKLSYYAALISNRYAVLHESVAQSKLIQRKSDGTWEIQNPVNPAENFADRWHEDNHARAKAFFGWIAVVKQDMEGALRTRSPDDLKRLLTERFGERTLNEAWKSYENALGRQSQGLVVSPSRALTRFNVAHRQALMWPVRTSYSVIISARFKSNGSWSDFKSDCHPLPKRCDLLFSATTNVPKPFSLYWQVVNTGLEAEQANQLRGQILPSRTVGVGGLTQKESTLYTGMHWIECFVVKDGICVARSGEFVVNIE